MRMRWLGATGLSLILVALLLHLGAPRLWPAAFFGAGTAGGKMMNGMMGGMMGQGGMMGGMMASGDHELHHGGTAMSQGGMMGEVQGNAAQPFDLRFLDQMILHHQGGVLMTQHMAQNSERTELRDLAQRIITAQQREIEQMQAWRQQWYPTAPAAPEMPGMGGIMGQGGMMMDQGQMAQMMGGQAQMDRMFLQMMIPHHEDAISMARQALEQAEHPELKTLSEAIITTQQAEIEEMQRYLKDWYGA